MPVAPLTCRDADLRFETSPFLTLGVEVEVQLVDSTTLDLTPAAPRLLNELSDEPKTFKPEFFKTMLEVCTQPCPDLPTVERQLRSACRRLSAAAADHALLLLGVGTHPLAERGQDRDVWDTERYQGLLERNQWIARHKNIFGLHVHLGARDGDHAIALINAVTPYLAHLLALSASSPYLFGQDTGLASARATAFESQPTAGPAPRLRCWQDFRDLVQRLKRAGGISSHKDLHWDIRPSPGYGTVEVRICDGQASLRDTLALVAATQCLFAWLDRRLESGERFAPAPDWLLRENKWRALRYGMEAEVVVNESGDVRSMQEEWLDLLDTLEPIAGYLGSRDYLADLIRILEAGPSYSRQRQTVARHGSLRSLVRYLADEWQGEMGDSAGPVFVPAAPRPRLSLPLRRDLAMVRQSFLDELGLVT